MQGLKNSRNKSELFGFRICCCVEDKIGVDKIIKRTLDGKINYPRHNGNRHTAEENHCVNKGSHEIFLCYPSVKQDICRPSEPKADNGEFNHRNAAGEKSDKQENRFAEFCLLGVFETAAEKINAEHQKGKAKFLGAVAVVIAAGIDGDKAGEHGGNHRPCRSDIKRSDFICRKCGCREEKRLNDVNSEK